MRELTAGWQGAAEIWREDLSLAEGGQVAWQYNMMLMTIVWAVATNPQDCARPSHPGVCFNFDDVQPPAQALTSSACCARCRTTAGCAAWTWFGAAESQCRSHPTWCSCYLKKGTSHRTNSSTCTSGVIGAPPLPIGKDGERLGRGAAKSPTAENAKENRGSAGAANAALCAAALRYVISRESRVARR